MYSFGVESCTLLQLRMIHSLLHNDKFCFSALATREKDLRALDIDEIFDLDLSVL